ncbi:MAG: protease inhibitor I42 family protein [Burkholderiales bacterium]|jgi:inhibitor of cysteine peptidase|nr:protease inhibitor I42 family protein [Burkholderiales bacterium]
MNLRTFLVAALAALALAACASGPKKIELGPRDDGKSIELKPGDELLIKLPANRSQGYRWILSSPQSKVLFKQGDPLYARPVSAPADAGGVETWSFRAVEPGEQILQLDYRRPADKAAEKTVRYTVTVR